MKRSLFALLAVVACGTASASPLLPLLPEASLDILPFSLLGSVSPLIHVELVGGQFAFVGDNTPVEIRSTTLYRMPVIVPTGNLDRNMPIVTPDPSIDFKIHIKP
jgi:hypothetical protein